MSAKSLTMRLLDDQELEEVSGACIEMSVPTMSACPGQNVICDDEIVQEGDDCPGGPGVSIGSGDDSIDP